MRKNTLLALAIAFTFCLTPALSFSQQPTKAKPASAKQLQERSSLVQYSDADLFATSPVGTSPAYQATPLPSTTGKVAAISAVSLGSASNVFTCVNGDPNQVVAVDSLDIVAFVHRNNASVYGGSSGHLRYDVSIDGGASFSNDIGPMNATLQFVARYPNITATNFAGGLNPLNAEFVYYANTLNTGGNSFDGHVYGLNSITTSGTPTTATEHYAFQGLGRHIPGGLCQSANGVYWASDIAGNGTTSLGDLHIYKGEHLQGVADVNFMDWDTVPLNHDISITGGPHIAGINIAFSPDGQTGWVAFIGDLVGGPDSAFYPILAKSTDCGNTWGSAIEVDLQAIPWIKDSLKTLWTDSIGNPASDGHASCAFDFDLTVDANGNPHVGVVICTGRDYSVSSGLAKFLGDVTTTDGGATWSVDYISPVLAFRTQTFGTATTVSMDNQVQVARDEGGCNIFFSWADSDTAQFTGNQNGIGFGESSNLAPNLRIAGKNVMTGIKSYPDLVTDMDLLWEGAVLFPAMAPVVMTTANGFELPIVTVIMGSGDPINPAEFFYIGNDVVLDNTGWCSPGQMNLSWEHFGYNSFQSACSGQSTACTTNPGGSCGLVSVKPGLTKGTTLGDAYPNPTSGRSAVDVNLSADMDITLTLHNELGQQVATLAQGSYGAGNHRFDISTDRLPAGIYVYRLQGEGFSLGKRLVVMD